MKKHLLFAIFAIGLVSTVQARIGETAEEVTKRYGKPVLDTLEVSPPIELAKLYQMQDIQVEVRFMKGKVCMEIYRKYNPKGELISLSELEIESLLKANAGSSSWSRGPQGTSEARWVRKDAKVTADLVDKPEDRRLVILSKEFMDAAVKRMQDAKDEELRNMKKF